MATEERKVSIDRFDGSDFGFWKMQIEDYLYQRKLHEPLSGEKPETMKQADWALLDRQALGVIRLTLSRNVAFNIAKEKTTASLMKALSDMYEKPSATNKVYLMRRLFNLKMREGASVADHINEFNVVVSQLSSVKIDFDDEVCALILLSSLPDSWSTTVTAVSNSSGSTSLTFDGIRDLILSEDIRRKESGESISTALVGENRGRTDIRVSRSSTNFNRRSQSRTGDIVCWNCGKRGHRRKDCFKLKNDKGKGIRVESTGDVAAIADGNSDNADFILSVTDDSSYDGWILDSGCSFHATPNRNWFATYQCTDSSKVQLGNNSTCDIIGVGNVRIRMHDGIVKTLTGVRHIPELKKNLISLSALDSAGYRFTSECGVLKVVRGTMVVLKGIKHNGLYELQGETVTEFAAETSNASVRESELWHKCSGHTGERNLKVLSENNLLCGCDTDKLNVCRCRDLDQRRKVQFGVFVKNTTEIAELIHLDVRRLSRFPSRKSVRFMLTVVDDYSMKNWVFVLRHKYDVVVRIMRLKALIEKETGKRIKHVQTDNSMEFCSELLNKFCMKEGIVTHRTNTNKSQRVAELMSKTLLETAHKMLSSAGMARRFLADALGMASYLKNRSPSTAIGCQTPEEVWSGNVADYSNIRIFGCSCFVRVSDGKLDGRTRKCMFLGYAQGERGYKLWCPELNSLVISREVTFDESPGLLVRSEYYGSVNTDLSGVQLEVELQPETPEVVDTNALIDTDGACSEVEPIEPMVAVTTDINKVCDRSPDRYGCNDGFALSVIKELVSVNPCGVVKDACGVGVKIRSTVRAKFKRGLDLEDVCAV